MAEEKQNLEINKNNLNNLEKYFDRPGILILEISYPIGLGKNVGFEQAFYRSTGTANIVFEGIFEKTLIPFYGIKEDRHIVKAMTLKEDFNKRGTGLVSYAHPWFFELTHFIMKEFAISKNPYDAARTQIDIDELKNIVDILHYKTGLLSLLVTYFITIEELFISINNSIEGDYWSRHPKIKECVLKFIEQSNYKIYPYKHATSQYLEYIDLDLDRLNVSLRDITDLNSSKYDILILPFVQFKFNEFINNFSNITNAYIYKYKKLKDKQLGKGYSIGVDSPNIGGLPEIVAYDDCSPPILYKGGGYKRKINKSRYIKLKKNKRNKQEGGAYNFIINPKTGKKVSIYGLIGENIIKNYIKELY